MKNAIRLVLFNLLLLMLLAEVASLFYIKIVNPHPWVGEKNPTYLEFSWTNQYDTLPDPMAPGAIDTAVPWTTWHPRNRTHRLVSDCFDVLCHYNSLGARGPLPDSANPETILVLGDSFTDGYGLNEDSTVPARITALSGKQTLNLGMSGHFGTTQMSLIYHTFAPRFRHRQVLVLMYLGNDFQDNDVRRHSTLFPRRYRPYRVLMGSDSSTIIYKGSPDSSEFSWAKFDLHRQAGFVKLRERGLQTVLFRKKEALWKRVYSLTYTSRITDYLRNRYRESQVNPDQFPSELTYDPTSWEILKADILSIIEVSEKSGARATFINLPSRDLLQRCSASVKTAGEYRRLEQKIRDLCAGHHAQTLSFFDHLNGSNENLSLGSLFFPCDAHYSTDGSRALAAFICAQNL